MTKIKLKKFDQQMYVDKVKNYNIAKYLTLS